MLEDLADPPAPGALFFITRVRYLTLVGSLIPNRPNDSHLGLLWDFRFVGCLLVKVLCLVMAFPFLIGSPLVMCYLFIGFSLVVGAPLVTGFSFVIGFVILSS